MASAKKPKLTTKQAKFVKAVTSGTPAYKAAMQVYDAKNLNVANTIAVENMQKPTIAQAIEAAYEKQGITPEALVQPLADGLKANKVVQIEGDFFQTDVPDHGIRLRAAGLAAQWIGIGKQQDGTVPPALHFHNHSGEKKEGYSF
jgi:hypothetical protein